MEEGDVFSRSGILSSSVVTVAPGRQQAVALKKRTCLRMESLTIRVEGGNSGRGESAAVERRGQPSRPRRRGQPTQPRTEEDYNPGRRVWVSERRSVGGPLPLTILRRDVTVRDEDRRSVADPGAG